MKYLITSGACKLSIQNYCRNSLLSVKKDSHTYEFAQAGFVHSIYICGILIFASDTNPKRKFDVKIN